MPIFAIIECQKCSKVRDTPQSQIRCEEQRRMYLVRMKDGEFEEKRRWLAERQRRIYRLGGLCKPLYGY